ILEALRERYPQVVALQRPEHLRADTIPMNEILLHDTAQVPADFYLQTHSTNPLLRTETISRAIHTFLGDYPAHDSLFSVTRLQTRLYSADGKPLNHDPNVLLRTQDLPPIYEENSCIYLFTREKLAARRNRLGERPLLFEIDPAEAWDIDDELDFEVTECLMGKM
ncbi:MAG TPA: acylneuraminate cytidylyltransferase family protein, partial [Anaerolineaceae bacterium]|nr:acylneuraminate cytidylyltransferase family protein [Anaerolineaceae bacterium]